MYLYMHKISICFIFTLVQWKLCQTEIAGEYFCLVKTISTDKYHAGGKPTPYDDESYRHLFEQRSYYLIAAVIHY